MRKNIRQTQTEGHCIGYLAGTPQDDQNHGKQRQRGSEIRVDWGDVTTKHSVIPWVRKYKRDRKRLPIEKLVKFKLSLEFS